MKISIVKILFAVAIGALLGYLCKIIANDTNEWCSLGVGAVTIIGGLVAALASYPNVSVQRSANTKIFAWLMTVLIVGANIIFAFTDYRQETYIVILALMLVIDLLLVYLMAHQGHQKDDKK